MLQIQIFFLYRFIIQIINKKYKKYKIFNTKSG